LILDDLKAKLVEYYKAGDTQRVGVFRYFFSQVQNREIELRPQNLPLTDEEVFKVLRKQIKNRKEAIELYEKAGRAEALEKEKAELAIYEEIAKYFPFELNLNPQAQFQKNGK
jgi:uncharacterized protein